MKKIDLSDLIQSGQVQKESAIGWDQVERLLKRARQDLISSEKTLSFDEAGAMDYVYKAMFHAANALLCSHGFRPGATRQHIGVIEATERILGSDAKTLILKFDRLRKRRNQFEYQGVFEMGKQELLDALEQAKQLVTIIRKVLEDAHPQKHFDW